MSAINVGFKCDKMLSNPKSHLSCTAESFALQLDDRVALQYFGCVPLGALLSLAGLL